MGMGRGMLALALASFCGCGNGGSDSEGGSMDPDASPGNPDASPGNPDGSPGNPDASPGNPDGSPANPDGSPGNPDASPGDPDGSVADASAADAMTGGDCPPLGDGDGMTPGWAETAVLPDPEASASAVVLSVDDAPDCSFVTGGTSQAGWFVARHQESGALEWAVDLGPREPLDLLMSVRAMPGGEIAVVRQRGSSQRSLVRLSADGAVLGEPVIMNGVAVHALADGGALVARSGALERLAASGQRLWIRSIGDYPQTIAELPDGRVVHAGGFDFSGAVLNRGLPDEQIIETKRDGCYVALYGADGSLEWARTIDTDGQQVPTCGAAAADTWVAAWVLYQSEDRVIFRIATGTAPPIETTLRSAVVVRYGDSGELDWAYTVDGRIALGPEALSVDAASDTSTVGGVVDGGVALTQIFPAPGGQAVIGFGLDQGWFARFAADGSILGAIGLWTEATPGSTIQATATRANGSALLAGDFSGTLVLGPFEIAPEAGFSPFIAEVH